MNTVPVVVIRASDNCFLDVLHCFAEENVPVIPVIFSWEGASAWISEKSIFFHDPVCIKNPAEDEFVAARQMEQLGQKLLAQFGCKIMLIATSDTALVFVNRHYEILGITLIRPAGKNCEKIRFIGRCRLIMCLSR